MGSLFWRQFSVLFWKNWIVLLKHPFLNVLRCFLLPVGYGIFLAVAQIFLSKPNNNGIGNSIPIYDLQRTFDAGTTLIGLMEQAAQLESPEDIPSACPQNFNLFSECFAAIAFNSISALGPINYTIRADAGIAHIDVVKHTSDFELRILPLQWAIDKAIIELRTGEEVQTPIQWPFTQVTNAEQDRDIRLSYIRGLRTLLVLALFICYVGIAYQLPGAVTSERATLVTAHMKSMGLLDSAKVISWHVSLSLIYLPAWIIVAIIWHYRIFTETNVGLVLIVHLLLGFLLASWSFFVATPFGKSPQLAAVASTFLSIVFAIIALAFSRAGNGAAFIFTIIFPPGFYIFAIRAICGFENHLIPTDALKGDPDNGLMLLPLIIAAIIDIFLWPWLSALWERRLYDARNPRPKRRWFSKRQAPVLPQLKDGLAISIKNLGKTFSTSFFRPKKNVVTAVDDLTLDIPKYGIFVLLGSNGAGKSTVLSILGGLAGRTRGSVQFESGSERPEPGTLGIVPQKNVLFPELTCLQTLRVWRSIKWSKHSEDDEDLVQLLKDCDLEKKINSNAATLSGGQKRKLQLAIGLVGGSKIVLVDECTSGVDPLSRRALWRTLTSFRETRTIIFTTHFLDEADLLADNIAILAAPGKLVAEGSPVALKRDLGEGYTVSASLKASRAEEKGDPQVFTDLLHRIREITPHASLSVTSTSQASFHLRSKDPEQVERVLQVCDDEVKNSVLQSYDVMGTTIEDIFLDLMAKHDPNEQEAGKLSKHTSASSVDFPALPPLELSGGRPMAPWQQALTIFVKRGLVVRRSWLTPLLSVLVAIAGSTIPLVFLSGRQPSCVRRFSNSTSFPLYMPISPATFDVINGTAQVLNYPPGLIATLGNSTSLMSIADVVDNRTFVDTITNSYRSLEYGGISMDLDAGSSFIAWEASSPGYTGAVLLNLVDNILYNSAQNKSGQVALPAAMIQANYEAFPPVAAGTLVALKWVAFFGAAMAVYTAFYALYVSNERRSAVQAMQFSNGLSDPIGLWLGHLAFDVIFSIISASVIIIIFAAASNQFTGSDSSYWVVLVLYGFAGTLFSYCVSLMVASPLAAFAAATGYQVVMFVLYMAAYLLTLTYAKTSKADSIITIIHFTLSILSPVASVMRAAFVSVNLFSLLCTGNEPVPTSETGTIMLWVDSGSFMPPRHSLIFWRRKSPADVAASDMHMQEKSDVVDEARRASSSNDLLRVLGVSKTFGNNNVVDDVTLGASKDTMFALLGPNGAGKPRRGDITPDSGDVLIAGESVIQHPKKARFALGVCPQFTAIDSQLTVREHLEIYGRLKGLSIKAVLRSNVESLLGATALLPYADRKLSLAISLIGVQPSVVLIDEFSTGVDAKMKREMWVTLRNVAVGKAVIITTHSMEEASALANKVGILAKRLLAVGTIESLSVRYATYEVHFTCRTRDELTKAQVLMSRIPGSRMADDVATRFEVPIGDDFSLSQLFHTLCSSGDFSEYTVEKATLESVFLKVIRENNISEEDQVQGRTWT
ncbi:P-loop containing nucleoside triphosphate hydrolase protein [Hymenopellis radicata]|nr:P-loop containing nucleoside triphosphate hydrolase protein [Hymenopellis radicata]